LEVAKSLKRFEGGAPQKCFQSGLALAKAGPAYN